MRIALFFSAFGSPIPHSFDHGTEFPRDPDFFSVCNLDFYCRGPSLRVLSTRVQCHLRVFSVGTHTEGLFPLLFTGFYEVEFLHNRTDLTRNLLLTFQPDVISVVGSVSSVFYIWVVIIDFR